MLEHQGSLTSSNGVADEYLANKNWSEVVYLGRIVVISGMIKYIQNQISNEWSQMR